MGDKLLNIEDLIHLMTAGKCELCNDTNVMLLKISNTMVCEYCIDKARGIAFNVIYNLEQYKRNGTL